MDQLQLRHVCSVLSRLASTLALAIAGLLVGIATGCSKKEEPSQIHIVLPMAPSTSASSMGAAKPQGAGQGSGFIQQSGESAASNSNGVGWNSALNPIAGSEVNCFAVFVGGSDAAGNSCEISNGTAIHFGPHVGFVGAGDEISVNTTSGNRTIYVIGLKAATAAACSDFSNSAPDGANLSEPFLIAAQPAQIVAGTNRLTILAALDTGKKVQDCTFINPVGGGGAYPFGDKRDGKIVAASASVYLDGNADNLGVSGVTHITAAGQLPSTKLFGATRRITAIASSGSDAGKLLTLGNTFTNADFEVGDEVVWYVAGGRSSIGSPDDDTNGACGGGLYIGRFGTSKISSVAGSTQLRLETSLAQNPSGIKNTNLANAAAATDFCTVVLSRISNFEQIDVPSGYTLNLLPGLFNYTTGQGGVLAIRADSVTVTGTLVIDATGFGFSGGAAGTSGYQGDGVSGAGVQALAANYNGGGGGQSSTKSGNGGGNAGAGGIGGFNSGSVGSALTHCSGICTPFTNKSSFMGGGGGGAFSAGGKGGGIVLVFAKSISGSGSLVIRANGATGGGGSYAGGSGAGGTVGLFVKTASLTNITAEAKGGLGGSVGGGAGGGGVVEISRCSALWSSTLTTDVAGGTLNGSGGPGAAGLVRLNSDPAICAMN